METQKLNPFLSISKQQKAVHLQIVSRIFRHRRAV